MAERTPLDARDLRKLGVPDTPPWLGQGLAVDETVRGLWHALDAPLGARRVRLGVENVEDRRRGSDDRLEGEEVVLPRTGLLEDHDRARRVDRGTFLQSGLDDVARGEPGLGEVVKLREELFARDLGRLGELCLGRVSAGRHAMLPWNRPGDKVSVTCESQLDATGRWWGITG